MDNQLQSLIKKLNVIIFYHKLDAPGHVIFPPILHGTAAVYIDSSLTAKQQKTVLLHELGHVAKHRKEYCLYRTTMQMKLKMEYGANRFMIEYLFQHYLNVTGDDPCSINYLEFMRQNDIPSRDENIVREIIAGYRPYVQA